MSWAWLFVAAWIGFILGFMLAAVLAAGRDDAMIREHNEESRRLAGLNDD